MHLHDRAGTLASIYIYIYIYMVWYGFRHTINHVTVCVNMNNANAHLPSQYTVWLVIFMGQIFHGLRSSDDFVGIYFYGVPTLVT